MIEGLVKSPVFLSFRAEREILKPEDLENIRFLPLVEMTNLLPTTFCETNND